MVRIQQLLLVRISQEACRNSKNMSFENKKFYIAAYNSSRAENAASSGVLGAHRSLQFSQTDYSSEEDSPYAPALRKERALQIRRNVMASEDTAKSNLLFQKMGITSGGVSDDDDEEEVVGAPEMLVIEQEAEFNVELDATQEEIEALTGVHEEEMSAAKGEIELLSKNLAAATNYVETLTTQIQVEKAAMQNKLKSYEDQIAQTRRLLEEKNSSEQASAAEETTLKIKAELLERQVATLQASGERAEAERSILAAENAELNDKLMETLAQLANAKEHQSAANEDNAPSAEKENAQKRENALQNEVKSLQDELLVVQSALKESNEAAQAASCRASDALYWKEQALLKASTIEKEKCSADRVSDDALIEAEYLRGEISKLENEVSFAQKQSALNFAAAEVLKGQQAAEMSILTSKLHLAEAENARLVEAANEVCAMVVEESRLSGVQDAERVKLTEKLAFAQDGIANLQAERLAYKDQANAACARTALIEKDLRNQIRSLTDQLENAMQQNALKCEQSAAFKKEIELLKENLATIKSEACATAASHYLVLSEANKRTKEAGSRFEMLEKQQTAAMVIPTQPAPFSPLGGGSARCGLVERKRTEYTDIDLESGGFVRCESDISHDGDERGPLTALALQFGAWERAVNAARFGDSATFAARLMLKRHQNAAWALGTLYLLALHVFFVTGRMGCAICM